MRALIAVVVAIVLLAVAAVALAPASLVGPAVAHATAGRITLAEAAGTIWNGSATLVGGDGVRLPLAWTTDAAALARGDLHVRIAPKGSAINPRADIAIDEGTLRVRDVSVAVPAAWLADALATSVPVAFAGDVDLAIGSLDWAMAGSRGDARVDWRRAQLTAPGTSPVDLGDVSATLTASGDRLAGPVTNRGGAVTIAGDVAMRASGAGEANLLVAPRPGNEAVARMLAAIAPPEGPGYRLRMRWQAR